MRCKGKPSLEDQRNDAGPVEYGAVHRHFHYHIMPVDMVDDEWKGVHQCQNEKGIGSPSVEDLKVLM